MRQSFSTWGRLSQVSHPAIGIRFADEAEPALSHLTQNGQTVLAHGLGRSYGDSALNPGGGLVLPRGMARFHRFDEAEGIVRADAGVTLAELNDLSIPRGFLCPVMPGTRFVTLGGMVANDVHGKNHHEAGSFGAHVLALGLRRSDGSTLVCSQATETDMLRATIGGLGLTGLIEWVELKLTPISSALLEVENIRFPHVRAFFDVSRDSADWTYTVAWIDCQGAAGTMGRGIFSRARHAKSGGFDRKPSGQLPFPLTPPLSLINPPVLAAFNRLYYHRPAASFIGTAPLDPFFFPLDAIKNWNRLYGPRGFYQYQCVVPMDGAPDAIERLLSIIRDARSGSFLAVLKLFGDHGAPGLLSFPMAGATLALDLPNLGYRTHVLMRALDQVVLAAGGRIYPAKDARMSQEMFRAGYPALAEFNRYRDSAFASGFARRVMEKME